MPGWATFAYSLTLRLDSIDTALSMLERPVPIRVVPTLSGIAVLAADIEPAAP